MTIRVVEQPESRSGGGSADLSSSQTWVYHCHDVPLVASAASAIAAVDAVAPATVADPFTPWLTLIRSSVQYRPLAAKTGLWQVEVTYEDPEKVERNKQLETGEAKFSFSTTGGTLRITSSLETIRGYNAAGNRAPADFHEIELENNNQTIGVTEDGEVEGVDIVIPATKFSLEFRHPLAVVTQAYLVQLEDLTGTVNDDTFFGRDSGEVLFLGATGSQGTASDPTVTYEFARMPNTAGQQIADIVGITKKGHEYLWVKYETDKDAIAKKLVKKPIAVYVERLYELADFALLGVGT